MLKFFLTLILLVSSYAYAWDDLIRAEEANQKILLEYDEDSTAIRIKYKSVKGWSLYKKGPRLSVDSPSSVESTLASVTNFLTSDLSLPAESEIIDIFVTRIEEFKYLSRKECSALHFDIAGQGANAAPIETLLDQVNRIRLAQSPGDEAFRSIHISTFETEEGPIQLRMVLARDGSFLKFSFAKAEGSLVDFNWEHRNGVIILKSADKEVLLEIDTSNFLSDGGLITVKSSTNDRFEEEERSFFRLNQSTSENLAATNWEITPYETSHFTRSVIKSGVPLSTGVADHTPVIQLRDKEIVFKRLEADQLESLDLLGLLGSSRQSELENLYNQCMGERLSFHIEEQRFTSSDSVSHFEEPENSIICVRKTQAEAMGLSLGLPEESKLTDFRDCLKDNGVANTESSFFSFIDSKLSNFKSSEYEDTLKKCYRSQKEQTMALALRNSIVKNTSFKEILPGEVALNLLVEQITGPYSTRCLEVISIDRIEQCQKYAEFLAADEFFSIKVSSRLSSMSGLSEDSFERGQEIIVGPLMTCKSLRNESAEKLFRDGTPMQEAIDSLEDQRLDCSRRAIVEFVSLIDKAFFTSALRRAGLEGETSIPQDKLIEMRQTLKACWSLYIEDEDEVGSLVEEVDYHLEACLPTVLQEVVRSKIKEELDPLVNEFLNFKFPNEDQRNEVDSIIDNQITEILKEWKDINKLEDLKRTLMPKVLATLFEHNITQTLTTNENITEEERGSLETSAARVVASDNWSNGRGQIEDFFTLKLSNLSNSESVVLRESLKQFYLNSSEIISKADARAIDTLFTDEELTEVGAHGRSSFNSCFEEYTSNSEESIRTHFSNCEKIRFSRVKLYATVKEHEERVSALLPLNSRDANKILVVNQYLSECFEKASGQSSTPFEEFQGALDNCVALSKFDLSMSLSLAQLDSYKEVSLLKDERKNQLIDCFSNAFIESSALTEQENDLLVRTLRDMRDRSMLEGGLLSLIPGAHISNGSYSPESSALLTKLISVNLTGEEESESFETRVKACEDQYDQVVKNEFREFVMRSIPSLDLTDSEDPNTALMRDFLDIELVELILEFQKVNETKLVGNRIQVSENSLENRLITSDLGMGMLVNFVELLGDLIGKGFVYDEAAMRTELVVFQSELKGFLRWYSSNAEMVSINEAQDFFQSSKLSEHLSMAVVSEKVYENFLTGISGMRKREIDEFFARKRCYDSERCLSRSERLIYRGINEKYDELRNLSREMTSSYDFRRIIRPETEEGREIIEAIKESYLMPKAIGQRMNARAEESMMNLIGEAILRDNTDGGFAERFVEVMAQSELDREEKSRYGITKWLWFDDEDFNWERLKETDAGLRAIDYYSRFIMLPEALGRPLGRYEMRLRKDQFRRLITAAQSENKD